MLPVKYAAAAITNPTLDNNDNPSRQVRNHIILTSVTYFMLCGTAYARVMAAGAKSTMGQAFMAA